MARDDYHVIAYKILVYLYARYKGKIVFDSAAYSRAIGKSSINESYLSRIYKTMTDEGLITGMAYTHAWGDEYIPLGNESELEITAAGIQYIEENDKMKKVGEFLLEKIDPIASLAKIVFP